MIGQDHVLLLLCSQLHSGSSHFVSEARHCTACNMLDWLVTSFVLAPAPFLVSSLSCYLMKSCYYIRNSIKHVSKWRLMNRITWHGHATCCAHRTDERTVNTELSAIAAPKLSQASP